MPLAAFPSPAVKKNILYLKQTFQCHYHHRHHYGLSNFRENNISLSFRPVPGDQGPPTLIRINNTLILKSPDREIKRMETQE